MSYTISENRGSYNNSVLYRPKMNGAIEAANKNVKKIIAKATETYRDWHEKLPFALHAYRTEVRTSTGACKTLEFVKSYMTSKMEMLMMVVID